LNLWQVSFKFFICVFSLYLMLDLILSVLHVALSMRSCWFYSFTSWSFWLSRFQDLEQLLIPHLLWQIFLLLLQLDHLLGPSSLGAHVSSIPSLKASFGSTIAYHMLVLFHKRGYDSSTPPLCNIKSYY